MTAPIGQSCWLPIPTKSTGCRIRRGKRKPSLPHPADWSRVRNIWLFSYFVTAFLRGHCVFHRIFFCGASRRPGDTAVLIKRLEAARGSCFTGSKWPALALLHVGVFRVIAKRHYCYAAPPWNHKKQPWSRIHTPPPSAHRNKANGRSHCCTIARRRRQKPFHPPNRLPIGLHRCCTSLHRWCTEKM